MRTKRNSLKKGTKWLPIFPIGIPILYNFKLFFFCANQTGTIYKWAMYHLMHYRFSTFPQIRNAKILRRI